MNPETVTLFEFLLRWAVVPLAAMLWWVMMQLARLDRVVIKLETRYDATAGQRTEDRDTQNRINAQLLQAIEKLNDRLGQIVSHHETHHR
jgi:hypothetical protein